MPDTVSPDEAAQRLGTTAPTVRLMWDRGELTGHQAQHGARTWLRIHVSSINAYLAAHGKFKRSGQIPSAIEEELRELRELIAGSDDVDRRSGQGGIARERDDLRARVISLQDALARMRAAAELHRAAERERSAVVDHLQAALAASERADELRRNAYAELEEAVSGAMFPGHPGELESGSGSQRKGG